MSGFAGAFRLLTRFPIPEGKVSKKSSTLFWFPLVGLVLGLFSYAIALLPISSFVRAAAIIAMGAYLTRGFHLDGLCDVADGFGGGWTKEATLRIMRDSSVGAFALITLVCTLLVQVFSLAEILVHLPLLLFVPALGRTMVVIATSLSSYAREGEGTASDLVRQSSKRHMVGPGIQMACFLTLLFVLARPSFAPACAASLFALLMTGFVLRMSYRRLGGVTGDVLGSIEVLSESAAYLGALILLGLTG
ncbi:MAG TPA: adenosylcobinamide-GDP ribazoletransferase [Sphaerochaeta sp.]|nr:adenosylcobinamide-GDP ribazoletransferase [Sphaerochaeta sp.]